MRCFHSIHHTLLCLLHLYSWNQLLFVVSAQFLTFCEIFIEILKSLKLCEYCLVKLVHAFESFFSNSFLMVSKEETPKVLI